MAVVEPAQRLLEKADGEGRIRGIALAIWAEATQDRRRGGAILARGLREARALHSRERRLVADRLYEWVRKEQGLAMLSDDPTVQWRALLGLVGWEGGAELAARFRELPSPLLSQHSWPKSFAEAVGAQWSEERARAFARASDERADAVLRCVGRRERVAAALAEEGIETVPTSRSKSGLVVQGRANLLGSKAYRAGRFELQDEASQLWVELVLAAGQGAVLDYCAGAGGKSLAFAAAGRKVLATDVRSGALAEAKRRAKRARSKLRTMVLREGAKPGKHPVVAVDAPCSGMGVLRRHPEYRWGWRSESLSDRTARQLEVLRAASKWVEPGGVLVYGTCSILDAENGAVVDAFVAESGFEEVHERLVLAPDTTQTDGFFGAVLQA